MAETRSTYFGLPRYSSGADEAVTRLDWEEMITRVEERVAFDDGTTADALPATLLKPGRYFRQSFADGYALHRRAGAAWEWQGGSVQPVRVRMRSTTPGDIMLSSDTGGESPTTTASWKASGEIATAGALRSSNVGAFGAALDADLSVPGTTGRAYVRTVASGDRALVLAAHDDAAGALLTARTAGGSDPFTIDSRGRVRASAAVGLGQSSPATNVPVGISPSGTDVTALDLYARAEGAIPALRVFRNSDDAAAIASFLPDSITIGRTTWSGGAVTLRAPSIGLSGATSVTGTLAVSETANVAKGLLAENNRLVSYNLVNGTVGLRSPVRNGASTLLNDRDMRHSLVWRKRTVNIDYSISSTTPVDAHTFTFTPSTSCWLDVALTVFVRAFAPGSGGGYAEPVTCSMGWRILNADGTEVLFTSDQVYELTLTAFDLADKMGRGQIVISDLCPLLLNADTAYRFQLWAFRADGSMISTVLRHVIGTFRESVWMGDVA